MARIADLGLEALELGWVRSVRVSEATCQAIRQAAAEHHIVLSVHAPYYINLNGDDQEWLRSRKRLMDAAYFGNLAGATEIIFHPGSYLGQSPEQALATSIERLAGCVSELRANDNPVNMRPETMGKAGQLGSLQETLEMARAVEGVHPCLDFAHLHARRGDGSLNTYEEWMEVLDKYKTALGQTSMLTLSCHLSGIEYSSKGEKQHLAMKESDFNLEALFKALVNAGCAGRLLCESPVMEADALYFKETWQSMLNGGVD